MSKKQIGIVLVVVGVGLLFWGYQFAGSFSSRVSELFSGAPSDKAMYLYIAGAVCMALGIFRVVK